MIGNCRSPLVLLLLMPLLDSLFIVIITLTGICLQGASIEAFQLGSQRPTLQRTATAFDMSSKDNFVNVDELQYRQATSVDIDRCFSIESVSYPEDEAASLKSLTYRQHEAAPYFLCAQSPENEIIGYVCATRCDEFTEESMSTHDAGGKLLAIHSVVVEERYRRQGIATHMLTNYIQNVRALESNSATIGDGDTAVQEERQPPIQSLVLLAKSNLLGFYVKCGFSVTRPSPIVHGKELWYDLELQLPKASPDADESWFVKTEQFCKPFPVVKPHLEAHKVWVADLRAKGVCVTSGYRVDENGKPGGGGLMFLAAKSYEDALNVVKQDPLVANECVDWELNGWIGQVGNVRSF